MEKKYISLHFNSISAQIYMHGCLKKIFLKSYFFDFNNIYNIKYINIKYKIKIYKYKIYNIK